MGRHYYGFVSILGFIVVFLLFGFEFPNTQESLDLHVDQLNGEVERGNESWNKITVSNLLKRFLILNKKSLFSIDEEEEFNQILSNEEVLREASEYLNISKDSSYSDDIILTRLEAIDILRNALAWKENPIRRSAVDVVVQIIKGQSRKNVKTLGDKGELLAELFHHAPEDVAWVFLPTR